MAPYSFSQPVNQIVNQIVIEPNGVQIVIGQIGVRIVIGQIHVHIVDLGI